MAEWHLPFDPPPQQAEEAVAEVQVKREWDPNRFLLCTHCCEPIHQGKPGMDFVPGVAGFGPKSGRPMIIETGNPEYEHATLHITCIYDYVFELEEQLSYVDEVVIWCNVCGEGLVGEAPNFCSNCGARAEL